MHNYKIYHIYPLGLTNISELYKLTDIAKNLGFNTILLGPIFESIEHGYDWTSLYDVDQRIGSYEDIIKYIEHAHQNNFKVLLDGVFNHCGRNFFAFNDIRKNKDQSKYLNWFKEVDFNNNNHFNDGFSYYGWEGTDDLVSLNHSNSEVCDYLLNAAKMWVDEFKIDGIRLDVAYMLPESFLQQLRQFLGLDVFLLGEIIHGDYNRLLKDDMLDSITNYRLYATLINSFNTKNLWEVAWTLGEQFGKSEHFANNPSFNENIKLVKSPCNFLDNHDVNRLVNQLHNLDYLKLIWTFLYFLPGFPLVYYGSEKAISGEKSKTDDWSLRPSLINMNPNENAPAIYSHIQELNNIRKEYKELDSNQEAPYQLIEVSNLYIKFARKLNSSHDNKTLFVEINLENSSSNWWVK